MAGGMWGFLTTLLITVVSPLLLYVFIPHDSTPNKAPPSTPATVRSPIPNPAHARPNHPGRHNIPSAPGSNPDPSKLPQDGVPTLPPSPPSPETPFPPPETPPPAAIKPSPSGVPTLPPPAGIEPPPAGLPTMPPPAAIKPTPPGVPTLPLPTVEPPPILIVPTPTPPIVNNQPPPGAVPVPTMPSPPSPPSPETPFPPALAPSGQGTCSIDSLKLKGCVDRLVRFGIGGTAEEKCCPVLQALGGHDAAVCLCTAIKAKLLDVTMVFPIALQVLVKCGNTPPPGFTCT